MILRKKLNNKKQEVSRIYLRYFNKMIHLSHILILFVSILYPICLGSLCSRPFFRNSKIKNSRNLVHTKKSIFKKICELRNLMCAKINTCKVNSFNHLLFIELKKKFNRNEIRVQDLLDELRRLEIRVGSSKDKLQALSACHASCNPNIGGAICTTEIENLDAKEKNSLDSHDNMVNSRTGSNSESR